MHDVLLVAATEPELCGHPGLVCGVGPVDAAATVGRALAAAKPKTILHVGVAGARAGSGIAVLDLVVGSEAVYEDLFTVRKLAPTSVLPDQRLVDAVTAALPSAHVMPIGTKGKVGGASGCQVEAMEGFAVLRAAGLAGVPAVEVRSVSNVVDDDHATWRLDEAIAALGAALPRLLAALRI